MKTLRALGTAVRSLAELRNEVGSGIGACVPRRRSRGTPSSFNASVVISEFLLDTWRDRRSPGQ